MTSTADPLVLQEEFALPCGIVTFRWSPGEGLAAEWKNHVPTVGSARHKRKVLAAYRTARNSFLANVATTIGGTLGILDVDPDGSPSIVRIEPASRH